MINGCAPARRGTGTGRRARFRGFRLGDWVSRSSRKGGRRIRWRRKKRSRDRLAADLDGSFEELVRVYQDRLYRFALRLTGEPRGRRGGRRRTRSCKRVPGALDLSGRSASAGMALRAWLYQITLNTARNRFRGKKLTHGLSRPSARRPGPATRCGKPADEPGRAAPTRATRNGARGGMSTRKRSCRACPDRYRAAAAACATSRACGWRRSPRVLRQPVGTAKSNVHRGDQRPARGSLRSRAGRG